MVMVLAAVIALAVTIPALAAGGAAKSGSVKSLSKRALAKAKLALRTSRGAKRSARAAAASAALAQIAASGAKVAATEAFAKAASAREVAGGAELKAGEAKEAFASTHVKADLVEGATTVTAEKFEKRGGPAVALTVPASGMVQVWAQATVEEEGDVSLYEDNEQVPGQAECAAPKAGEGGLFSNPTSGPPITLATPAVGPECANSGAPAPVLFQTTTGPHTFELRYAACACQPGPLKATFSERRLIVQPLP
jgi:hypothetical protein